MLNWLVSYGVEQHKINYDELDVNDRTLLQEQINKSRKSWHQLLELLYDIQGKYMEVTREISEIAKRATERAATENTRVNTLLSSDNEYVALEAQQKALAAGMSMINQQIDFCKNDLRILNSVFYNKF